MTRTGRDYNPERGKICALLALLFGLLFGLLAFEGVSGAAQSKEAEKPGRAERMSPASQSLPVLTEIKRIRNLTSEQANLGYPVHLRAVVTYQDDEDVFIQDSAAGIWIENGPRLGIHTGDDVQIDGLSAAPDFAPEIAKPRAQIMGKASFPAARRVGFDHLASGAEDSQWVEVEGIVHRASLQGTRLVLEVAVGEGRLTANINEHSGIALDRLVDAKVLLHGVAASVFNRKNQLLAVLLHVPSLREIEIEEPPTDAADLPTRSIESLLRFTPEGASGHRVKVHGTVTLDDPGRTVCLQDSTQGLCVAMTRTTALAPGDVVDVLGFPARGEYTPTLNDALVQRVASAPAPKPSPVTVDQLLAGNYDAQFVQIRARLLDTAYYRGHYDLAFQARNLVFHATLEGTEDQGLVASIPRNSTVTVAGVCVVEVDENRSPQAFRLQLRSAEDLKVIERPSWWTLHHTLSILGLVAGLFFAAMVWVGVLQRRVHAQTAIILHRLQREVILEERYRDLFENASDVVYTHDLAGNLTSLNRAGERITGYRRDKVLGMNLSQIVAPEDLERACWILRGDLAQGGTETYELEIIAGDGRRVPLEVSARTMHQDGQAVGVQCNARDITDRKRVQAEMERARQAAEAANRTKSEFLANVSHEIRTPMNGILGMTQLMLETPLNSEQLGYLNVVKSSGESLLTVINDILDFSKVEAGSMKLEMAEFNLRHCVSEAVALIAVQAAQKGLDLAYGFRDNVPEHLIGDPVRINQVLWNLTYNAVKFTPKGRVFVEVDLQSRTAEHAWLHFSVQDTGIGIPKEKHGIVFEPFRQADGSSTRRFGGTGLGLTISSQLVSMMGGRIWLESEPGKGSTFHFTLRLGIAKTSRPELLSADVESSKNAPLLAVMESHSNRSTRKQAPGINSAPDPGKYSPASRALRVLVAEDNPVNQKLASRILEKQGYDVVLVSNGREAIMALEDTGFKGYDAVVMDVQMPEMDGLEATVLLRNKEKQTGTHVPVIAVTAHAMKGDRERCFASGMDGYVRKPVRARELIAAIEAMVESAHPIDTRVDTSGRVELVATQTVRNCLTVASTMEIECLAVS